MAAGQGGAVIQDSDVEIELRGEWRNRLGDVARASNPKRAGRVNGFAVIPVRGGIQSGLTGIGADRWSRVYAYPHPGPLPRGEGDSVKSVEWDRLNCSNSNGWNLIDGKIFFHAPGKGRVPRGESGPKIRSDAGRIWQDQPENLAAADQAVVPAEIMVQQKVERGGLAGAERLNGALLDFGFQAAAAERAQDAAIGIKQRLRADLLRAGTFHRGDDAQGRRLAAARGLRERLEDGVLHGTSACLPAKTL